MHTTASFAALIIAAALCLASCATSGGDSARSTAPAPSQSARPISTLESVAGSWQGKVTYSSGRSETFSATIEKDGRCVSVVANNYRSVGASKVVDGKLRTYSETSGLSSTYLLYDGPNGPTLRGGPDDGRFTSEMWR
jgi:hypothetical protein